MSAIRDNALTVAEQNANAKRRDYSYLLWVFCILACIGAVLLFGAACFEEGMAAQARIDKRLIERATEIRPTTSCANLATVCAAEVKRKWRTP